MQRTETVGSAEAMQKVLTDSQIASLLAERKIISQLKLQKLKTPEVRPGGRPDKVAKVTVKSTRGKRFLIKVRQCAEAAFPRDFHVMLSYLPTRYRRYDLVFLHGHHGFHPNRIEIRKGSGVQGVPANRCHIHMLTKRYQEFGKPMGYAEETDKYDSFLGAVDYLCHAFGFRPEGHEYDTQYPLFGD
jgi:hypothetical protein